MARTDRRGSEILVSEPYPIGIKALTSLLAFVQKVGAGLTIDAASYHYPNGCIRIEISEQPWDLSGGVHMFHD